MNNIKLTDLILTRYRQGWTRWAAWLVCMGAVVLLGAIRKETDAEFTFASLALFPVLFIAWMGGKRQGIIMALLAVAAWEAGDLFSDRHFSASWIHWANAVTHFMTYSMVALLVAQVRLQLDKEHEHATYDALTGLKNRRAFLTAGEVEVDRAMRYRHHLAVVFLDLDNFKQLNDTRGHDAGDAALKTTAKALLTTLRSSDRVARLGGDEFSILLPEVEYDEAVEAGHKISVAVNNALRDFPPVTGSIGIAWFERADRSFSAMLKASDELMYGAKESGKNNLRSRRFISVD